MSTRINARIDDGLARQLDEIRRMSGKSLTDLIEAALTAYCRKTPALAQSPFEIMRAAGFIGVSRGSRNLSRDYKRYLTRSLEKKHGDR